MACSQMKSRSVQRLFQHPQDLTIKVIANQVAAPAETRTPNLHRANQDRSSACGWKHGDSGTRRENPLDSGRPPHRKAIPLIELDPFKSEVRVCPQVIERNAQKLSVGPSRRFSNFPACPRFGSHFSTGCDLDTRQNSSMRFIAN